jgi:predicted secreted protein
MASLTGNAGVVSINGNNIAEVRSYSIEVTSDTIENTVMTDNSRQYVPGLSAFSGSADVYWDATHFTTADLDGLIQGTVGDTGDVVTVILYPEGTGANWTGDVVLTGYSISASFDGMIEASVSFQGTGALTYTAS